VGWISIALTPGNLVYSRDVGRAEPQDTIDGHLVQRGGGFTDQDKPLAGNRQVPEGDFVVYDDAALSLRDDERNRINPGGVVGLAARARKRRVGARFVRLEQRVADARRTIGARQQQVKGPGIPSDRPGLG
jgi:hypothetical protein